MGFTTAVLVSNDFLDEVAQSGGDFGRALVAAIARGTGVQSTSPGRVQVMTPAHADSFRLYAVGSEMVELAPAEATLDIARRFPEYLPRLIADARRNLDRLEQALAELPPPDHSED